MDEKKTKDQPRIGVYVCKCGGNISDVVNVEEVAKMAEGMDGVVTAKIHTFMCSDPGQGMIEEDIKKHNLNRIVVASCSPSLHETTFRKAAVRANLNPYQYEQVNIREQCSWPHHDKAQATEKAKRLVAAGVGKAFYLESLKPIEIPNNKRVIVIGGGIAGITSAISLADNNTEVVLLEKSPFLGGRTLQLEKLFPNDESAYDILESLITELNKRENIKVYTNAELDDVKGYIGNFDIKIKVAPRGVTKKIDIDKVSDLCPVETEDEFNCSLNKRKAIYLNKKNIYPELAAIDWNICTKCGKCKEAVPDSISLDNSPEYISLKFGSIIIATGFDHYQPKDDEFGFNNIKEVITLPQLIRNLELNKDDKTFVWNGKKIKNIAFIHCVGSRQVEGIHTPDEDGNLNQYCSRVCCTATLQMINELKEKYPDLNVFDLYRDIRSYGRGHEEIYEKACKNESVFFRYTEYDMPVVKKSDNNEHPVTISVKDVLTYNEELNIPVDLVVLSVGMVNRNIKDIIDSLKISVGSDRFLQEVHPKLRPVELAVGGIMVSGTCQAPMDVTETTAAAKASAAKAALILNKEKLELDPFVAEVYADKCTGCGKCLDACGYKGAIEIKDNKAVVNPGLCKGCGACVAVCPERAIDVKGWTLKQFETMIENIANY